MFTGIVEEIGEVVAHESLESGARFGIRAAALLEGARRGESIAVDGCCLTVEEVAGGVFRVFASRETLRKTTLGDRPAGSRVNLERAMRLDARLGGHMVSGHVDATGSFLHARAVGDAREVWVAAPPEIISHSIAKGSICVDGISLTLVEVREDRFSLWIIPETWTRTTLSLRRAGDRVNLESDLIAKYVFRFMERRGGSTRSEPPSGSHPSGFRVGVQG